MELTTTHDQVNETQPTTTIAVIVAIEDYRFNEALGINKVEFARNDATKFKKLLLEDFQVPEENITLWIDKDATRPAFEGELKYIIRNLSKGDRFIFYYAGHGFYQKGTNKLTCWDTHPSTLNETTVSIKDVLLDQLETSECQQSLVFLDCCATELNDSVGRNMLANFNKRELEDFIKSNKYHAVFMSCSPGESSYPNRALGHGIWTWHLIEALKGNIPEAIAFDGFITDTSLKNYLYKAVPKYITENTTLRDSQHPYTIIKAEHDFLIRALPEPEVISNNGEMPNIKLDFQNIIFRKYELARIKSAPGFQKNHRVLDVFNSATNAFTQRVFHPFIQAEIQEVYQNTKDILSLRKKQIQTVAEPEGGSVECDAFRYYVEINQHADRIDMALITRKLTIRVSKEELPDNFDDIFPRQIDEVVIPIIGAVDFADLVERFENFEEVDGGTLRDNEITQEIVYNSYSGIVILVAAQLSELSIKANKPMKFLKLIDTATNGLSTISNQQLKLIN